MVVLHYITFIDQVSGGVGAYMKLLSHPLGKVVELHVVSHRSENELSLEKCTLHYIEKGLFNFIVQKRQFVDLLDSIKPNIGWWKERTVEEVAKAMKQALDLTANELEKMDRRGNRYVRNNLSSDKVAVEMTKLYRQILSKSTHSKVNAQLLTFDRGTNCRLTFKQLAALYYERRVA